MERVLVIGFAKIFEVAIITSSFCFAGIMRHSIILHYLRTCCIKATVCSIRYFDWQKSRVAF